MKHKSLFATLFILFFVTFACTEKEKNNSGDNESEQSNKSKSKDYLELGKSVKDDHYKAIDYFTMAIELDSNSAEAYEYRGLEKQSLGDIKGAISDLNIALELNPLDSRTYLNRGSAKYSISDFEGALLDYQKALSFGLTSMDSSSSYFNIGLIQNERKQYRAAIMSFTQAIALNPFDLTYLYRANAKLKLNDLRGAIQDYDESINLNSNLAVSYFNRGLCKLQLGKQDAGCLDLSKAAELGYSAAYKAIQDFCY